MLHRIHVLILLTVTTLAGSARGSAPAGAGSAGLKGNAVSYMEISGTATLSKSTVGLMSCYSITDTHTTLTTPQMFSYTSLDEAGNILVQGWYMISSLEEDSTYVNKGPVLLKEDGGDIYYFYEDVNRDRPVCAIVAGGSSGPFGYFTFTYPEDEVAVTAYNMTYSHIYDNVYTYRDGLALTSSRVSGGQTEFVQEYGYHNDGTLAYTESKDRTGLVSSRMEYGKGMKISKMVVFDHTGGGVRKYSYRYRYHGGESDYSYTVEMEKGKHPYYNHGIFEVRDGLMVSQKVVTALPEDGAGRKNRWGERSVSEARFVYNSHGNYTHASTSTNGREINVDVHYLYDTKGNWYVQTMEVGEVPSAQVNTILRSINYRD